MRNHIVQEAIEKAEKGDYSEVNKLLEMCLNPYEIYYKDQCQLIPKKAFSLCVSCSS